MTANGYDSERMPPALAGALLVLAVAPFVLDATVDFSSSGRPLHGVLDWSAVAISLFTAALGALCLWARPDFLVTVVVVSAFAAGLFDAVPAVASIGLVPPSSRFPEFVTLSWTASRLIEALTLTAGALVLLAGSSKRLPPRSMGAVAFAIAVVAAAIGLYSLSLEATVARAWSFAVLVLVVADAFVILPLLARRFPSLLAKALCLGAIPNVVAEFSFVFGSSAPYDRSFVLAHSLALAASVAPLSGIVLRLARSYRREVEAAESMEKLVVRLKSVEDQLRSKEVRLDQLTNNIKEVFWISSPNGNEMHYVSPAYEEIFGLTCKSLYREPGSFLEVVHLDDRPMMVDLFLRRPERDFEVDYRIFRDGATRWLRTRGFPIRDSEGVVYRLAGITEDVTDRKSAEEELRKSEARTRALLRAMPDLMFRVSRSGVILDYHASPTIRLYKPPSVFLGSRFSDVMPELGDRFLICIEEALSSGVVQTTEYRLEIDGHVGDYEARFAPSTDDEVLMVVRDVTESHRLQKEILNVSHREQERIGHDLHDGISQQLTGIALLTKALQQQLSGRLQPEAESARQIASLVEDTLAQTKSLARGLAPVELEGGGLASALEDLARSVETIHGIRCHLRCGRDVAIEDAATAIHVYRIAQEAVSNAIRHGDPNRIVIDLSLSKGKLRLVVEDDGRGIAGEVNAANGMGLHIMRYRSRMIDGALQVRAAPGGGTVVSCEWPIAPDAGTEARAPQRRVRVNPLNRRQR